MSGNRGIGETLLIAALTAVVVTFAVNAASEMVAQEGGELRVIKSSIGWARGVVEQHRPAIIVTLLAPAGLVLLRSVHVWAAQWVPVLNDLALWPRLRLEVSRAWLRLVLSWMIAAALVALQRNGGGDWWVIGAVVLAVGAVANLASSLRWGIFDR